jgi:arginyl-tRNA synthetase
MSQDLKSHLAELMRAALRSVAPAEVGYERSTSSGRSRPRTAISACNLAMQLARTLKRNPRQLAQLLLSELPKSALLEQRRNRRRRFHQLPSAPGSQARSRGGEVLEDGPSLSARSNSGGRKKVLVEFVSANPTGPLHVGHGRGAAYGDSLCSCSPAPAGTVTSEYYVNDAGRQMDILAVSTWLRYLELRRPARKQRQRANPFSAQRLQGDYVRRWPGSCWRRRASAFCGGCQRHRRHSRPARCRAHRRSKLRSSAKRISTR